MVQHDGQKLWRYPHHAPERVIGGAATADKINLLLLLSLVGSRISATATSLLLSQCCKLTFMLNCGLICYF